MIQTYQSFSILALLAILLFCKNLYAANEEWKKCTYKGKGYSHGSQTCQTGKTMECEDGTWVETGGQCSNLFDKKPELKSQRNTKTSFEFNTPSSSCSRLFNAGKPNYVGIKNNCDKCTKAVIHWTGGASPYTASYILKPNKARVVPFFDNHSHGELIGDDPCKSQCNN